MLSEFPSPPPLAQKRIQPGNTRLGTMAESCWSKAHWCGRKHRQQGLHVHGGNKQQLHGCSARASSSHDDISLTHVLVDFSKKVWQHRRPGQDGTQGSHRAESRRRAGLGTVTGHNFVSARANKGKPQCPFKWQGGALSGSAKFSMNDGSDLLGGKDKRHSNGIRAAAAAATIYRHPQLRTRRLSDEPCDIRIHRPLFGTFAPLHLVTSQQQPLLLCSQSFPL